MTDTLRSPDDHLVTPTTPEIIKAHLEWMRAGAFASTTMEDVERLLFYADGRLPNGLVSAVREELVSFLARDDWSAQTKATYRQHIRRFFQWATDDDDPWISFDPSIKLRRPRVHKGVPRPASDENARAAITQTSMPFRLHCLLATYGGLRCIEVAELLREHLTETEIRIHGKGDKPAVVPMHPLIWAVAKDLPDGPVTAKLRGGRATDHWVSLSTAYHLRKQVGIQTTMHRLRAWYITMIQRTYKDATVTQRLARHESLNTTQGYVLVADQAVRDAVAGLPDLTDQ
jgi:integrase